VVLAAAHIGTPQNTYDVVVSFLVVMLVHSFYLLIHST
jgi:hypothetical protein